MNFEETATKKAHKMRLEDTKITETDLEQLYQKVQKFLAPSENRG